MSQVTVEQLAEVLGISVDKLITQMSKANINLTSASGHRCPRTIRILPQRPRKPPRRARTAGRPSIQDASTGHSGNVG